MGEQQSIQQQFISEIADSIFEQSVNGKDTEEQCFFKLRFDPENEQLDNQNKNNNDIVSLMNQKLGCSPSAIQRLQKKVIEALVNQYEQEMKADELDIESILNAKRGEKDIWKRVYSWLWDKQFPRYLWETLRKKSDKNQDWIRFVDDSLVSSERGSILPKKPNPEPKIIPNNQSLNLVINIDGDCCNHHLLLFNRSLTDFHLVCPSGEFSPNSKIEQIPWLMPTQGSIAEEVDMKFQFATVGTEEFLAIVIEQPLELEWFNVREGEETAECSPQRLVELWEQLEKNKNWRSFYQSFEVI